MQKKTNHSRTQKESGFSRQEVQLLLEAQFSTRSMDGSKRIHRARTSSVGRTILKVLFFVFLFIFLYGVLKELFF